MPPLPFTERPSSTSIANDLEDAEGKVLPLEPAIRKGQMFLRVRRSSENPPEVTLPPSPRADVQGKHPCRTWRGGVRTRLFP